MEYDSIKGLAPDPVDPKAREIATPIVDDIKTRGAPPRPHPCAVKRRRTAAGIATVS